VKVSHRLQQLDRMVTQEYDHIWDCCCDHGLLGLKLLKRLTSSKIHFVDIIDQLILNLQAKLEADYSGEPFTNRWQTYCIDVAELPLSSSPAHSINNSKNENPRHLVIIAGVGGERTIKLLKAITAAYPDMELEFLLCPVHHNYNVREAARTLKLGLVDEHLLRENGRFYECLHLSTQSSLPVSRVGSTMWDFNRLDDLEYLHKTITHYQRIQKNTDGGVDRIISEYQALLSRIEA